MLKGQAIELREEGDHVVLVLRAVGQTFEVALSQRNAEELGRALLGIVIARCQVAAAEAKLAKLKLVRGGQELRKECI